MKSVLMVLTGAKIWTMKNGTAHPTGFWAEEFIKPHQVFTNAGLEITLATPGGVTPTVDDLSLSLGMNDDDAAKIADQRVYLKQMAAVLAAAVDLEEVRAGSYDAVFVVGGHGPMQDLAVHPSFGDFLASMLDAPGKTVSAVCHGPASFLPAHRADGSWLFKGRALTGFSNEEETQATFAGNAPWLLEDRLRLAGAKYEASPAQSVHVVIDGNLITGQNPASAEATATSVVKHLGSVA